MHPITRKDYSIILTGITIFMVLSLGLGISSGNLLVIGVIMISALGITVFVYRQICEVMTDALSDEISGKAARAAIGLTVIITSLIFASALTFYFTGGWGTGYGYRDNGPMIISFSQYYPSGHEIYLGRVQIRDPENITGDELFSLEQMFLNGARVREAPLFFGLACGSITVLLAGFYAIFTFYFGREYEVET
jgi:hypothetical protein